MNVRLEQCFFEIPNFGGKTLEVEVDWSKSSHNALKFDHQRTSRAKASTVDEKKFPFLLFLRTTPITFMDIPMKNRISQNSNNFSSFI